MAEMSLAKLGEILSQTWPARLAKDAWGAVMLPGDVYQGNVSMYGEDGRTNPEVIKRSMSLAGLMTGGGIGTGVPVGAGEAVLGSGIVRGSRDAMKPLTEKQFYNQYSQHVDLRGRAGGNAADIQRQIMEEGFKRGGNVNTLPPYRGGEPRNIVDMKMAPKAGDTVYLVPNSASREMGNGRVINEGWKPAPHEVLQIGQDYPALYQEYLRALGAK